jgi:TPP-dependent indolepyruvate ferredoxin oxidoreductase alpha subunit
MSLRNIFNGWSKSLGLVEVSEENKELARKRVAICVECPHAKEMWLKKFIDGALQRDITGSGIGCSICGCPINERALVPDEKCEDKPPRW